MLYADKYNLWLVEKNTIISALNHYEGNRTHAAKDLGITVRTIRSKLHEYDMAGYLLNHSGMKVERMKRYWATWETPTECFLPMTYPPTPAIKGWWKIETNDTGEAILCAVVDADGIKDAKAQIIYDWPEATSFNFCNMKSTSWMPSKKYILEKWMKERL